MHEDEPASSAQAMREISRHVSDSLMELATFWALRTPSAPALIAPGRPSLDYRQLQGQLGRIGAALGRGGVCYPDRVAVVLPNGPEMATAVLGAAAWTTCAPLNPAYGEDDFRFYLGDLRPKALILPESHCGPARSVAEALGIRCVDAAWQEGWPAGLFELRGIQAEHSDAAEPRAGEEVALVLHTSGTTSRPKMVPLTQRNVCRSAAHIASTLRLTPRDRCLNVMPLFHVHGLIGAFFASLSAGASMVCMPGMSEGKFAEWVEEFRPTWYTAVPTIHEAVLRELSDRRAADLRSMRFARSSSAALPPRLARELEAALGVPILEAYGMTEAAHQIASNPLPPSPRKTGSVGRATGVDVAIMDEEGHLLPADVLGEIVIRGESVMSGYETGDETNRIAFANGWFRTGDLGLLDTEGYLHITGRLKEMINRGGEKVSPVEVEAALLAHAAARECAVFAVRHPTLGQDVVAAVVLQPGASAGEETLRGFLFGRLPEAKIPSRIVIVDAIPKSATGKIQRIGLAERLGEHLATAFVAPRSDTEMLAAAIFAEVLGLERVGALDNFFALGGDSLRAGQVIARVHARKGVDVPLPTLFRNPTVGEFAREIERSATGSAGKTSAPPPIRRRK
jgi:acyl-CoA synthetase (AMP-forming)/AMP-acid ligase II/aryl carrier-like protein